MYRLTFLLIIPLALALTACDVEIGKTDSDKTSVSIKPAVSLPDAVPDTINKIKNSRGVAEFKADAEDLKEKFNNSHVGNVLTDAYDQIIDDFTTPADP